MEPVKEVIYEPWIDQAKFAFDIKYPLNFILKNPEMESMLSWKKYPDIKYQIKTDDGKIIQKQNKRDLFNSIVKYILFVYDKNSPFHKRFPSLTRRREEAIIQSGMPEELMTHDEIVSMIIDFLVYINDKLWSVICTNENLFVEYMSILNSDLDNFNSDKDLVSTIQAKEKVRESLEKVMNSLEAYYDKFYNGDKDLQEIVSKKPRLTPEKMSGIG